MGQHRFGFAMVLATAIVALPFASSPGWAMGSVAIGLPSNVATGGFAMGISYNYGSKGDADSQSLKQCLSFQDAPDSTRALCKVYQNFENECFAMAMDPEPGTYGFGYKVAATQDAADASAMNDCKNTSGTDRKTYCQVSYRVCDGKAK